LFIGSIGALFLKIPEKKLEEPILIHE
jgi:hypothetical protein